MEQNKDQSGAAVRGEAVAEFNINDMMIVTLTEFGAQIWNSRYDGIPIPAHLIPKPVLAGHVLKDQMWDLMKTFGPHIHLGGEMPFLKAIMAHEKVSARDADAPSEPSELLYTAVMNIPCERTMSHFVTLAEFRAYKEGHHAARHAAVNLVAAFKSRAADAPSEPAAWMRPEDGMCVSANTKKQMEDAIFGSWAENAKFYSIPLFRAADALDSQPTEPIADVQARVRDAVAENLRGLYYCGRVWSAWSVGTMGEDDFSPAEEDDDIIANITDAVMATIAPVSSQPTEAKMLCAMEFEAVELGYVGLAEAMAALRRMKAAPDADREALIACLGDDAATLSHLNPDDEMAQTMREAIAMLESDEVVIATLGMASSQPTDGGVRND